MAGGRFRCLSCLLAYTAALLLGVSRHDVEAAEGKQVIHKKVGDSVELLSNLPVEGVTRAIWKYGDSNVANKDSGLSPTNPFKDRVEFNNTSFSLTIRDLSLQDSGEFSFISLTDKQRPTVFITLQVHEPKDISNSIVFFNISEVGSNGFCRVFLECKANPDSGVTYIWTVGNQTRNGSRLQYTIKPQDGETTFTCNASNVVSGKLASKTLRCNNSTESSNEDTGILVWTIVAAVGGLLIIIIITVVSGCLCKRKWSGSDSNELTVYADISDFSSEVGPSDKPCSLYDTIDARNSPDHQMPQTIYDKIQIERMRKASVSPYQEVS